MVSMSAIKRVFLIINQKKIEKFAYLKDIICLISQNGSQIFADVPTLSFLTSQNICCAGDVQSIEHHDFLKEKIGLAVVLGGDGTILSAARAVSEYNIPILGINLGNLGFLAEVMPEDYKDSINRIFKKDDYSVERRLMIKCEVERAKKIVATFYALNEVVIRRESSSKMNISEVFIDGKFVDKYCGDGLIISTPTGSTAYSLSCGGPILSPELPAFLLIPICAFTLASRPLIVPETVKIKVNEKSDWESSISTDGQQSFMLQKEDAIYFSRSPYHAGLIKFDENNFFDILRTKLGWGNFHKN